MVLPGMGAILVDTLLIALLPAKMLGVARDRVALNEFWALRTGISACYSFRDRRCLVISSQKFREVELYCVFFGETIHPSSMDSGGVCGDRVDT
jgi:hypothetical protein